MLNVVIACLKNPWNNVFNRKYKEPTSPLKPKTQQSGSSYTLNDNKTNFKATYLHPQQHHNVVAASSSFPSMSFLTKLVWTPIGLALNILILDRTFSCSRFLCFILSMISISSSYHLQNTWNNAKRVERRFHTKEWNCDCKRKKKNEMVLCDIFTRMVVAIYSTTVPSKNMYSPTVKIIFQ